VAILALSVASVCSGVMTARHIWAINLPGCGQAGGCDWAINGPYSKILGLPVSFVGLAYFTGMLVLLAISGQSLSDRRVGWVARTGALASLGFIGLMVMHGQICPWCAFTHVANLIFWGMVEQSIRMTGKRTAVSRLPLVIGALSGLVVFGIAWSIKSHTIAIKQAEDYRKGMESVARIGTDTVARAAQVETGQAPILPETKVGSTSPSTKLRPKVPARFGGRYWEGNPEAPVRIVMFHDYQCTLCKEVEGQIAQLLRGRSDFALSVKQWPFDADCNRFMLGVSMHPGACRAAKVAEAAGVVGGEKAFWEVHRWLVDRGGDFSQTDLLAEARTLGIDPDEISKAINSPAIDSIIRADIEEGMAFGLTYTPLIFVNGYRVDGWQSAAVLPAAIDRAAAVAKARPRTDDRPDLAIDMQFRQWLITQPTIIPMRPNEQSHGPAEAKTTIVVYGDLTCAYHASAYMMLERPLKSHPEIRYIFRDFPLDSTCNDLVKQQINGHACEASRLAIAAGQLGGPASYWKAHDWIVRHRGNPGDWTIDKLAQLTGLDPAALERTTNTPQVNGILSANITLAKQAGVMASPTIFVNGKMVAGWRTPGLLDRVVSAAVQSGK
jgi:protein-disulfide isomerase/uncharacterized membrane protein